MVGLITKKELETLSRHSVDVNITIVPVGSKFAMQVHIQHGEKPVEVKEIQTERGTRRLWKDIKTASKFIKSCIPREQMQFVTLGLYEDTE